MHLKGMNLFYAKHDAHPLNYLLYKDESVYVPPDQHKLSPQNLAWAPHFTQAKRQPKIQAPSDLV
jgi:hypothetical protein